LTQKQTFLILNDMTKKIIYAEKYGFCFGVKRAINTLKKIKGKAYTLGPIIHNPQVVENLKKQGIYPIKNINEIKSGTLFIRAHGVADKIIKKAEEKGLKVIDLTCPLVKKAQVLAKNLEKEKYQVVILGAKKHPEIKAISANLKKPLVIENEKEVKLIKNKRLGIISQTTSDIKNIKNLIEKIKHKAKEVKVYDTICPATKERQEAAIKLAKKSDIVIVIGGKNSSNTKKLKRVCQDITKTHHIQTEEELKKGWFKNKKIIGITAGASTPDWLIEKVVRRINRLIYK